MMCGQHLKLFVVFIVVLLFMGDDVDADKAMFRSISSLRDCMGKKHAGVCIKERALEALNETILSDKPIVFYDMVNIERNPDYHVNISEGTNLPEDFSSRSSKLTDILYDKVEEFFKSRVVKFNMAPAFDEARGKKDKGGKGGMMMLAMGGMACMMAQLFMGKIAFLAGTALILAKVALFISAIIGLKKLSSGGGGGGESHVVYAAGGGGDYGHSHGGGGWHRSLDGEAQSMAYRAYATSAPDPNFDGY